MNSCFVILVSMLLVCGLRDSSIGIDTFRYVERFINKSYSYDNTGEKLFVYTTQLIHLIGGSANLWLFFVSSLIYIPLFYAIRKDSPYPSLSSLIFMISTLHFFPESMNIIRQSIATVFLLLAYVNWNNEKRDNIVTCSYILIGLLFHMSTLIALPFFFLKKVNFNRKTIYICLLIAFFLGVIQITSFINDYIEDIKKLSLLVSSRSDYVANITKYSAYADNGTIMNWKGIISVLFPPIWLCLITIPDNKYGYKYSFYYNILFISTLLYCFLTTVPFGFRIVFGLQIVQILVIPFTYIYGSNIQRVWLRLYIIFLTVYYVFYLYSISIQNSIYNNIIPYKTFFSN